MSFLVRNIFSLLLPGVICLLSPFTGLSQTGSVLQVSSFEAELLNKNAVRLKWEFVQHGSNDIYFIIERSADGIAFHPLYKTGSSSPTAHETGYQYTDHVLVKDSVFYRIAQLDENGTRTFSDIRKIYLPRRSKAEVVVMPNPVFNNAVLIINDEGLGDISCTLYDMTGKNIRSYQVRKTTAYMQQILDMYSVPKGEYILSIRGAMLNETKRIVKQ